MKKIWRLLDDEKASPYAVPVLFILLTLVASAALLLVLGKNPVTAMTAFLQGSGFMPKRSYAGGQNMFTDFLSFLGIMTPMLLASLAIIIGLKTGLFNIGVSGQMLLSGFLATILVGYAKLPSPVARALVILIGIVTGSLLGALVGFLKYKFNIHEVVSTIMFNYIISYVTGFLINTYYVDPIVRSSRPVASAARLTLTGITIGKLRPQIPLGLVVALIAVFLVRFLLDRTALGFELKAVGTNRSAARYAGIREGRSIILGMLFSGMLAGLAGVTFYLGYYNTMVPKALANLGYDAIAVALLGNTSPIAAIFASALVTIFQKGSVYMSSAVKVPGEIASVITGILLFFGACSAFIRYYAHTRLGRD